MENELDPMATDCIREKGQNAMRKGQDAMPELSKCNFGNVCELNVKGKTLRRWNTYLQQS